MLTFCAFGLYWVILRGVDIFGLLAHQLAIAHKLTLSRDKSDPDFCHDLAYRLWHRPSLGFFQHFIRCCKRLSYDAIDFPEVKI